MALNPQYDAIGKAFTQQYYAFFDDPNQRQQLAGLYNVKTVFNFMHENNVHDLVIPWLDHLVLIWKSIRLFQFGSSFLKNGFVNCNYILKWFFASLSKLRSDLRSGLMREKMYGFFSSLDYFNILQFSSGRKWN